MRLFVGGQAILVPARWYFCPAGAKEWQGGHGCEASPWLDNGEVNLEWGEVLPRGRKDAGRNRGYQGRCYVGDPQWFIDGQLPVDILTTPPPLWPACCRVVPPAAAGEITLGGSAVPNAVHGPTAAGEIVLGGFALPRPAIAGELVLGRGALAGVIQSGGGGGGPFGGLTLGGSAVAAAHPWSPSPSPSGSGGPDTEGCDQCPDGAAVQYSFTVANLTNAGCDNCGNAEGRFTVTNVGGCTWRSPLIHLCDTAYPWTLTVDSTISLGSIWWTWQTPKGDWDCLSPLTLQLAIAGTACGNVPQSITIYPV